MKNFIKVICGIFFLLSGIWRQIKAMTKDDSDVLTSEGRHNESS